MEFIAERLRMKNWLISGLLVGFISRPVVGKMKLKLMTKITELLAVVGELEMMICDFANFQNFKIRSGVTRFAEFQTRFSVSNDGSQEFGEVQPANRILEISSSSNLLKPTELNLDHWKSAEIDIRSMNSMNTREISKIQLDFAILLIKLHIVSETF